MSTVGELDIQELYEEFAMSKYVNAAHRDENILLEVKRLRAEVASLKEEQAAERKANETIHASAANMRLVIDGRLKQIDDLTQQLAAANEQIRNDNELHEALVSGQAQLSGELSAANGRVEKYREALELIRSVASGEKEIADLMDDTDGLNFVQKVAEAALSDLPEADKDKS